MDGVAEQRHRPGQGDHAGLDGRGQAEDAEGQPQRAHALPGGLQCRIDLVHRLVAVRGGQVGEAGEPPPLSVLVPVTVVVLVLVLVLVRVVAHGALAFDEDGRRGRRRPPPAYYVRMSARMHLSPAQGSHPQEPGPRAFEAAAELLALLADRTRLALLHTLAAGEADVASLTGAVGAARPAVSQHLARLRMSGLVTTRKEGRRVIYALTDGHLKRLVAEALGTAGRLR